MAILAVRAPRLVVTRAELSLRSWRLWLGVVALLLALVSLAAFMTFSSVSVHMPKALAYQPSLLVAVYLNMQFISSASGTVAVILALVALLDSPRALRTAGLGLAVGVVLFFGVMFAVSEVMLSLAPPDLGLEAGAPTAVSIVFAPSPPAVGMVGPVIGTMALLISVRGVAERRPAIGALIVGGLVMAYWLLSLVVFGAASE